MPSKIEGFLSEGKAATRMVKIGTLTYAVVETSFYTKKSKVKILLFDYNNALIMYNQATGKWKGMPTLESDSVINRYFEFPNTIGRESFIKSNRTSQISLGVCDRFYLMLTGHEVDLMTLRSIAGLIDLSRYPRTPIDNPKSR